MTPPTATLTGPLTEAILFAAVPTVTLTLTDSEYNDPLLPRRFTVTENIPGTGAVTVLSVTRTSPTVATLTLTYSGEDIIPRADGVALSLSIAVGNSGHNGFGERTANSLTITPSTGTNICGRTEQVRDAIVAASSADECTSVTDLGTIGALGLVSMNLNTLQPFDFAGLTRLETLNLELNTLTTLPGGIFDDLGALLNLNLSENGLTELSVGVFDELDALITLRLEVNSFTARTGLPVGIFDEILDTVTDEPTPVLSSFTVDQNVRDAHFVCSRDDADDIVTATAGVDDCLRITAAQFEAYNLVDATLSGLTVSAGTLDPAFARVTLAYAISVAAADVTVTPTATNAAGGATITVNGATVTSGSASAAIDLPPVGSVVPIPIVVTAVDGTTMLTYTVNVLRTTNICGRTAQVRDAILVQSSSSDCMDVPDLATIGALGLMSANLNTLQSFDFAGLTRLETLNLELNTLTTLPDGIFDDLGALLNLNLSENGLTELSVGVFDELDALITLRLEVNSFTARTGLPIGIFDEILDTVTDEPTPVLSSFTVDQNVRDAHFVCSRDDADDIVAATDGVTDCLRITAAQFEAYNLVDATLSGLTVSAGTLDPAFARVTLAYAVSVVDADVTVTPTATNTAAAGGATITVNGATVTSGSASVAIALPTANSVVPISIVVTAADGVTTQTYMVNVTRTISICGRTAQVRDAILVQSSSSDCMDVPDLATIGALGLMSANLNTLQSFDFAGLTRLETLNLELNTLTTLPDGIFDDLGALLNLNLSENGLTELSVGVFDELDALITLRLEVNSFTARTGLPIGIFDEILDTVTDEPTPVLSSFTVDQNVRDAHFVCSRDDSAAIVAATTGVTDCLRVSSAQLTTFLATMDATLSGLAVSDGGFLNPSFAADTTTYTVLVANLVTSVTVMPTASQSGATITVNGATVASGSASVAITLEESTPLAIPIIVTAADGTTRLTYTVTASRDVSLSNICLRTPEVRDAILDASSSSVCTNVPDLATITTLNLLTGGGRSLPLRQRDFAGLDGLTTLGLVDYDLTVLPPGIFAGLSALTSLTLSNSEGLTELPDGIFDGLSALEMLDLSDNRLGSLPSGAFADLNALTSLTLSGNRRGLALPRGIFAGLSTLETLNLGINALTSASLPDDAFANLSALTSLTLSNNALTTLPTGIFAGLSALQNLRLDRNSLTSLPGNIFNGLTNLADLPLRNNQLTALDANIFVGLESLRSLSLDGNLFTPGTTSLPNGIFDDVLDTLVMIGDTFLRVDDRVRNAHFVCARTDFADVVAAIAGVTDCLLVSSTDLNDFETPTVATLRGLTISEGALDPVFDSAMMTYTVEVANHIDSVTMTPTATNGNATITVNAAAVDSGSASDAITLMAPGTPLAIPIVVTAADSSTMLTYTVTVTRSTTVGPNDICSRTEAVRNAIVAASTAIDCRNVNAAQLASVPTLSFPDGAVTALASGDFAGLTGLTRLSVPGAFDTSNNRLTTLPQDIFAGLRVLTVLSLSNNALTTLRSGIFADLTSLVDLQLNNNRLSTLSADQFVGLTNLESLTLNDNALTTLPQDIFAGLTSLTRLRLDSNGLIRLDAGQFASLTLNTLGLFGNPFTPGTGLPAGIFDDVITTLETIGADGVLTNGFSVDMVLRGAHFVCSRTDFEAIVTATSGVDDCLLVSSTQFTAYLAEQPTVATVTPSALTVEEDGGTATYTVFLNTAPTANVTIAVVSDDSNVATVSPASLIFTISNWNTAQTVTVTTLSDNIDNPGDARTVTVTHTATSTDTSYGGADITTVIVTVTDNDDPPMVARIGPQTWRINIPIDPPLTLPEATIDSSLSPSEAILYRESLTYALTGPNIPGLVYGGGGTSPVTLSGTPDTLGTTELTYNVTDPVGTTRRLFTVHITSPVAERTEELSRQILPRMLLSAIDGGNQLIAGRLHADRSGTAVVDGGASGLMQGLGQWLLDGEVSDVSEREWSQRLQRLDGFSLRDFIDGLSFAAAGDRLGLPGVSLYGGGGYSGLSGDEDGALDWDGDVYNGYIGVDTHLQSGTVVGVLAAYTKGEFDYSDADVNNGEYEVDMSSVHPYIGWSLSEGLDVWVSVGYGVGEVELDDADGKRSSDLEFGAVAVGADGRLYASDELIAGGHSELRLRGDASVAQIDLAGRDADGFEDLSARRARLVLEASHTHAMTTGSLRSGLELGVRHDGGDSQSGQGLELGGSIKWHGARIALSGNGRVLTLADYDEWGVSGELRVTPEAGDRGLSFSLSPTYGRDTGEELWKRSLSEAVSSNQDAQLRMDSEIGYGIWLLGGTVQPYLGASLRQGGPGTQRMGARLELGRGIQLELEGSRHERTSADADHRIKLQWEWSW